MRFIFQQTGEIPTTVTYNHRLFIIDDRACPRCGSGILATSVIRHSGEEYWAFCNSPNGDGECNWRTDETYHSDARVREDDIRTLLDEEVAAELR